MQLGRKLVEGWASDPEADEIEQPPVAAGDGERPEPEPAEPRVRV